MLRGGEAIAETHFRRAHAKCHFDPKSRGLRLYQRGRLGYRPYLRRSFSRTSSRTISERRGLFPAKQPMKGSAAACSLRWVSRSSASSEEFCASQSLAACSRPAESGLRRKRAARSNSLFSSPLKRQL